MSIIKFHYDDIDHVTYDRDMTFPDITVIIVALFKCKYKNV